MRHRLRVVPPAVALILLIATASCDRAREQGEASRPANPLQGVWSMTTMTPGEGGATIDPSQPGLFIFTDQYYSAVYSLGADPRPLSVVAFSPTPEEMIAQYETIIVNTGTYEANGAIVTFSPMVAKSPEFIGGHSTMDYQVSGDTLTLTPTGTVAADGASPTDGAGSSMRLRRLR